MGGAVFYSYKPYLHLALSRECIITFNEKGVYIAKTPEEEKLLREYAKNTRNSYNIIEAGGELGREDLIRLHEECEDNLIAEAAPLNVQVRLRAYCMIWELKQKYYKADTPLPYVSKASHKADEDKIKSLEARIIKGGSDEERAVKAVAEAKEYLEIVAGSRVRDNTKNRVF